MIPGLGRSPGEGIGYPLQYSWASLVAQTVKNPPATREIWIQSLIWEDPLEEGMETYSNILAWRIPWTEDPGGLQSMGSQRVKHNRATKHSIAQPQNGGFPGGSVVKNPPAKAGDVGLIPDQEGPLEVEMTTHSSILAWEISWTEEPGRLQPIGS